MNKLKQYILYALDNSIARNYFSSYLILGLIFLIFLTFFSPIWYSIAKDSNDLIYGSDSIDDAFFLTLQVLTSAGYDDTLPISNYLRVLYAVMIIIGLFIFATLISLVNENIHRFMVKVQAGLTTVIEDDHTLILGWNKSTIDVIIQLAHLRNHYYTLNESYYFGIIYYIPFLRGIFGALGLLQQPSTSVAARDIVIIDNNLSKKEMHQALQLAFVTNHRLAKYTTVGKNIICRIGDPQNIYDLIRVSAHRAAAIIVMMNDYDTDVLNSSKGRIESGATIRTSLALRNVLLKNPLVSSLGDKLKKDLRVVLQLQSSSSIVEVINFKDKFGNAVMYPIDESKFLDSLLFRCAAQPGLASLYSDILDLGLGIRSMKVTRLQHLKDLEGQDDLKLVGITFEQLQNRFLDVIFIGLVPSNYIHYHQSLKENEGAGKLDVDGYPNYGLCPDPQTILTEDDIIIYISKKDQFILDLEMEEKNNTWALKAQKVYTDNQLSTSNHSNTRTKKNLLICGWLPIWTKDLKHLSQRLHELASVASPGSLLLFVNEVKKSKFEKLMTVLNFQKVKMEEEFHNKPSYDCDVYIHESDGLGVCHILGDANSLEVMEPIIMETQINTAIVLGSQTSINSFDQNQDDISDTRILSILLLLRKLYFVKQTIDPNVAPMHVVTECGETSSSNVAMFPETVTTDGDAHAYDCDPDFVNWHGMYAMVLSQIVAYPYMQPIIQELFEEENGVDLQLLPASLYIPVGVPILHGVVQHLCRMAQGERTIYLGYTDGRKHVHLMPNGESEHVFQSNESLCILRRQSRAALRGEGVNMNMKMNDMFANQMPQYSTNSTFRSSTQSDDSSSSIDQSSNHDIRTQPVRTSTFGNVYFSSGAEPKPQPQQRYADQIFSLSENQNNREGYTANLSGGGLVDDNAPVRVINKRTNNPQTPSATFTSPQKSNHDTNMNININMNSNIEFMSPTVADANDMNVNTYQRLNAEYDSDVDGSD